VKHVESTTEVSVGDVVLSGSFFFLVEGKTPTHFSGKVWNEQSKRWGRSASVPLPSPCQVAHLVDDPENYFPVGHEE
jgi:hypothetical protein